LRFVLSEHKHFFDKVRNVRAVLWTLFVVCVLLFVADLILERHVDHPWEAFFGFYVLFGFFSCVVLVLIAKQMRKVLMRKENYYEDND